jgi:tetratricopeptide (TPR) repeat protein
MLKSKIKVSIISSFIIAVLIMAGSYFLDSCTMVQAQDSVEKAYDLRMHGHADSAVVLLNEVIKANPEEAKAYYELARAQQHLMLARQKYDIPDVVYNASKATDLDPENIIFAQFESNARFLEVYMELMGGNEDVHSKLEQAEKAYEKVLELNSCFTPALITLTEINAFIPVEMGGNPEKAKTYAARLEACDKIQALRANVFLLPEDANLIEYWEEAYKNNDKNAIVCAELGKAYLLYGDLENGREHIMEAFKLNPENCSLLLDLARATMMNAMQNRDTLLAEQALLSFEDFLDSDNDIPASLKAYAYGMMGITCYRALNDKDMGDKYMQLKEEQDPFCTRAFGPPSPLLFTQLDELSTSVSYYSRPF